MDERHCGNAGWHLSHRWGGEWADMGALWFECPGSYPATDPRLSPEPTGAYSDALSSLESKPTEGVECPHWSPGRITLRKGCTACAAEAERSSDPSPTSKEKEYAQQ